MSDQNHIRLALHSDFLISYKQLSKVIQKKTRLVLKGLRSRSHLVSMGCMEFSLKHPEIIVCRIDDTHRMIMKSSKESDLYFILYVNQFNEAMQFAYQMENRSDQLIYDEDFIICSEDDDLMSILTSV